MLCTYTSAPFFQTSAMSILQDDPRDRGPPVGCESLDSDKARGVKRKGEHGGHSLLLGLICALQVKTLRSCCQFSKLRVMTENW